MVSLGVYRSLVLGPASVLGYYQVVHEELRRQGFIRTDYPPRRDEVLWNKRILTLPREELEKIKTERLKRIVW